MRWRALVPAIAAVTAACGRDAYFVCNDDADCGGPDAVCELVGACSFPDPKCPSGRRFGEASAPSIAGECTSDVVDTSDGTSTSMSTSTSTSTSSPTTDESTTDEATTEPVSSTGSACPPDWWDCAWAKRVQIRFTDPPESTLTAFPVLVLLGPPRIDYDDLQADAEDLRFVSATGEPLPFEVESWDPAGVSVVWVAVDEVDASSDRFFLYYANPVAENAQDAAAVWGETHRAVWHLGEGTLDSTGHEHDATPVGNIEYPAGQIGSSTRMLSGSSRLTVAPTEELADVFVGGGTISAWIRPHGWGGGDFGRIVHRDPGTGAGFQLYLGATGQLRFSHHAATENPLWSTADEAVPLLRWSYVAVTYTAGSGVHARLWVDGVEQDIPMPPAVVPMDLAPTDAEVPIDIGNRPNNDRVFQGRLDELRIEKTERSADWIRLQHLSGRDELLAYDPPEVQEAAP